MQKYRRQGQPVSDEIKARIIKRHLEGSPYSQLAKVFGLSKESIGSIVREYRERNEDTKPKPSSFYASF